MFTQKPYLWLHGLECQYWRVFLFPPNNSQQWKRWGLRLKANRFHQLEPHSQQNWRVLGWEVWKLKRKLQTQKEGRKDYWTITNSELPEAKIQPTVCSESTLIALRIEGPVLREGNSLDTDFAVNDPTLCSLGAFGYFLLGYFQINLIFPLPQHHHNTFVSGLLMCSNMDIYLSH